MERQQKCRKTCKYTGWNRSHTKRCKIHRGGTESERCNEIQTYCEAITSNKQLDRWRWSFFCLRRQPKRMYRSRSEKLSQKICEGSSVYLLFSEQQKCVPEQQNSTDERHVFLRQPWHKNDSLIHVLRASSSCGVRMVVQSFWTTRAILPHLNTSNPWISRQYHETAPTIKQG